MRDMTPLCELAKKHQTDKGGRHLWYGGATSDTCHEYTPVYWDLLNVERETTRRVLEIGVNAGSSLRMWEEFFPNAEIIGLDNVRSTLFSTGRIKCYYADQSDPKSLQQAMSAAGPGMFDLIIDDGSHEDGHIITSFKALLPYLRTGGHYVVEDMLWDCYPEIIGQHVPAGYRWEAIPAPDGIGKAHCPCSACEGKGPENLLVIRRV